MEITVKSVKVLKTGENKYGPWSLYKIEAADGKIYTTLADGADKLTPGTVFEPAEVMLGEEKDGVQEFKFKKFTLVTAGSPVPEPKTNGKPDMSKDDWAEKDRLERWSRECDTCFMGIIQLVTSENYKEAPKNDVRDEVNEVLEAALKWALEHFTGQPAPAKTEKPVARKPAVTTSEKDFDELMSGSEFKNAAEFAARVKKDLGIYPSGICKKMGVDKIEEIADYQAAYELLKEDTDK